MNPAKGAAYDTIVIGAGHNGLTAAAYLARAGQRVLVIEALDRLGGFCTTDQYLPDAAGFRFSPHALDHVLMAIEPSVATELGLARFGLDYREVDPFGGWIDRDGRRITLWRDLDRTVAEIALLSPADAVAYRRLIEQGRTLWRLAIPYLMGHPTRPDRATIWRLLRAAWAGRGGLLAVARLAMQPAEAMIEERFTHPAVRSLFMNLAASGGIPTDAAGSALLGTVLAIEHDSGVLRPRGGSGGLIEALAAHVRHHGGEIVLGAAATEILIERGGATGIVRDGQAVHGGAVLAAIDPVTLAEKLIGLEKLPERSRREIAGIGQYRSNLGMGAIGARLSRRPTIAGNDVAADFLAGTMFLGPSAEGVRAAVAEARAGHIPTRLPLWLILPSVADRSLVPPGSTEETAYIYLPVLPHRPAGASWRDLRPALYAAAMATIDDHLPGFSEIAAGHFVHTPDDLAGWSHGNRGGPYHVDLSLDQLGPWRPTPSFNGYRTPIAGLFHAGAGAHPLGTLNGWSGRSAARLILSDRRKPGRRSRLARR